jgi:PKD repeat protein
MFKKILPLLLFALSFIFFSQAFAEEVVCECSPKTVNVGEVVSCNAYFQGEGNPPCDWVIDWGDGSSGGARTHAYSKSGTYTIRCIAKFKGIWCGQGSTTITQVVTVKPQRSCSDSDGGINPAVKGKVILKEDGKEVATAEDYCYSSTHLVERFCQDSNNIGFQIISCSGECKEGVCTQAPTPSPTPTVTISNVIPSPNPFSTSTRFQVITQPSNTPVDKLEIKIFDLSGKQVATLSDSNTTGINWDGDNLANGAYLYVANVTHQGKSYGPFKDKVVIQRGGGGGITITSFTANPQSGNAPLNVTFTLSASSPKGLKGIIWYFGDGNTATTDISGNPTSYTGSASWTYQNAGTFSAYAKVKDSAGNTATSSTVQISVSSGQGPTPSGCTDSDGGKNYYQKGVVTTAGGSVQLPDFCDNDTVLIEHFCKDNVNPGWERYNCPNGCQDGACKGAQPSPQPQPQPQPSSTISCNPQNPKVGEQVICQVTPKGQNPCRFYFNWGDGKEDTLTSPQGIHTYQSPGTYTLTVTIRYQWLLNTCPVFNSEKVTSKIEVSSGETPSPTPTVTISNVIPSPNPFSTSTRFQVITQPSNTPVDKLEIKIFDLSGKQVATLSDSNTTGINWDGDNLANGAYLYVANVTHQGKSYGPFKDKVVIQRGGGGGITITSFTANPQSGNAPLNVTFTLSASSPKGLKGIIWYFGDGNTATTDISGNPTSYTGSASWTYQNAGTFSAYAKVKDSAGNTATSSTVQISVSSGQGPTPSGCTDSDGGKNYYQKGVVTTAGGSVQLPDFCDNDTVLIEHFCKDNVNPGWERYNCPNGCQDGACKGAQPSPQPQPQPQPSSTISCNPQNPKVGEQVICQVTPKGQNPCRFYFNWGDGKEDTLTSPQGIHTYQSPGTYTLTVTIRYQWLLNTCPVFNSEKVTSKIEVSSGEEVTPKFTVSLSGPTTARENSSFILEYASNIPKWDVGAISLLKDGQEVVRETYYKCTIANFNECTGYLYRKESVAGIYSYQVKMYDRNNNLLATSNIHKVQVGEVTPTPTPVPTEPVLSVSPSATKVDFQIKGKDLIVADFYIFDLTGKAIAEKLNVLPNEAKEEILWSWDLTDKEGKSVRSGLYLYKVKLKYANNTKDFEGRFAVEREAPTEVGASNWLVRLWKAITEFFKVFKF